MCNSLFHNYCKTSVSIDHDNLISYYCRCFCITALQICIFLLAFIDVIYFMYFDLFLLYINSEIIHNEQYCNINCYMYLYEIKKVTILYRNKHTKPQKSFNIMWIKTNLYIWGFLQCPYICNIKTLVQIYYASFMQVWAFWLSSISIGLC